MPSPLTHDDPVALGPYRLLARLGSGGMGTVYLGRTARGRTVALKTMHARIAADPDSRTRFRLEVDAARVIGGRYGAQVVDADPHAETPWLATEYVFGPPLDDAVQWNGPLPEASVRALGAALANALGQLHHSDVVHRDLKPSNIMVTAYGPKVIDFGIARAIGDARLTRTGAAVGTPAFMSPEQATGQEHDAAGDVFALAGVLVFAATGHGPFGQGQPADLLYRVRYGEPDLGDVPPALTPLLARCLAKDPGLRPTTSEIASQLHDGSGEFADHLPDAVLSEIGRRASEVWAVTAQRMAAPTEGSPPPAPAEGSRPPAPAKPTPVSRRRLFALGGGVAAGVAAAAGGFWYWRDQSGAGAGPGGQGEYADNGASAKRTTGLAPLWKVSDRNRQHELGPLVPHPVPGTVLMDQGGLAGLAPRTGAAKWGVISGAGSWQYAVANGKVYRIEEPNPDVDQKHPPLAIHSVNSDSGGTLATVARLSDSNGSLRGNQLLCVADEVLYLAVGDGADPPSGAGEFRASQKWTLRAVDGRTGKTLWTRPLPSRRNDSNRLHFLAARVVGNRLITLQEREEGAVRVVLHNTRTGAVSWEAPYSVDDPETVREGISADTSHVYLGAGQLRALRLSDGRQVWSSRPTHGYGETYSPPTLKSGVLYAVVDGAGLVAVDPRSGKQRWAEKSDTPGNAFVTCRPVIGARFAYYKNGVTLRAVSLASHTAARTYVTSGEQFFGDEQNGIVIAVANNYVAAYPLA
ncbi:serine/threonine-protein kinase [Streptomyces antnestii]|uniref:Serine/threonine-protein kinase n=1 Tax=Streptomyces antnestii TaxID=2494256 RepID=A0A437PQE8_9ACTN|nr:serine/threonine-protein kinase [Streptomyces sp. San01]RVU24482.1 serine/threonine-protein kinase [Streptomyces sp. San01]